MGFIPLMALPFGRNGRPVVVLGDSMKPSLHSGQIVWMRHWRDGMTLRHGDIVVFRMDGGIAIKRVLALPGERIACLRFRGGACMLPDEMPASMAGCLNRMLVRGVVRRDDVRVPAGHMYAVGDNRTVSCDSRDFGPVPLHDVIGVLPARSSEAPQNRLARLN